MTTALRALLPCSTITLLALSACAGADAIDSVDSDPVPAVVSDAPQAKVTHVIPRGGSSTLSLRTLPNATCFLHPLGEPADIHSDLRAYADDTGIVRLHAVDTQGLIQSASLALDCTDDQGHAIAHQIDVSAADGVRAQAPAEYAPAVRQLAPALDVDPMSLSADEIAARGYPPRPDQAQAPEHYKNWLSLLQSRPTVIKPHLVTDPTRTHGRVTTNGSGTSNNWSGYVIYTPSSASPYAEVYGDFVVPKVTAQSGFWNMHYSSFWVGIDGYGTPDVLQDGTQESTYTIFWTQWTSYTAWTEWYPLSEKDVSNFSVNPGDEIACWTWVGTSNGTKSPTGNVAWFYMWNKKQNTATGYLSTKAPSGTVFNGHQAEWVLERPEVNGSLATLANYQKATMTYPAALDFNGNWHYYNGDSTNTSVSLTMMNGSDVLSTVAAVNANTIQFTWVNYQ
jgi:hypothetical protein